MRLPDVNELTGNIISNYIEVEVMNSGQEEVIGFYL